MHRSRLNSSETSAGRCLSTDPQKICLSSQHVNTAIHTSHQQTLNNVFKKLFNCFRHFAICHCTKKQKKMLNHAIWLVVESTGNFYSRFRSAGVLATPDAPIQRDHIYPRKQLVGEALANEIDLADIVQRAQCCIVTKDEHVRLSKISTTVQGHERYRLAEVEIHDMATYACVARE